MFDTTSARASAPSGTAHFANQSAWTDTTTRLLERLSPARTDAFEVSSADLDPSALGLASATVPDREPRFPRWYVPGLSSLWAANAFRRYFAAKTDHPAP
jgi:hypothetical protein